MRIRPKRLIIEKKDNEIIKLVALADTHFGSYPYGKVDIESKLNSRMLDLFKNFDSVISLAIERKVDFFLHCGDVYKLRSPKNIERREFLKRVKRLLDAKIRCFFIIGNHDVSEDSHSLDFEEFFLPGITIVSKPSCFSYNIKGRDVNLFCLPWLNKTLDSQEERKKFFNLFITVPKAGINIMAAHLHVQEANIGSNDFNLTGDHTWSLSSLMALKLDAIYLGHIHKQQILSQDPFIAYTGSLGKIDFGEKIEKKGYYYSEF